MFDIHHSTSLMAATEVKSSDSMLKLLIKEDKRLENLSTDYYLQKIDSSKESKIKYIYQPSPSSGYTSLANLKIRLHSTTVTANDPIWIEALTYDNGTIGIWMQFQSSASLNTFMPPSIKGKINYTENTVFITSVEAKIIWMFLRKSYSLDQNWTRAIDSLFGF